MAFHLREADVCRSVDVLRNPFAEMVYMVEIEAEAVFRIPLLLTTKCALHSPEPAKCCLQYK
jgi:hypothetical protein